jgi:hypothetical protein
MGMAKDSQKREGQDDIELHPDAWERFTEFVKRLAKAGPQHRPKKEDVDEQRPHGSRAPKRNLKG